MKDGAAIRDWTILGDSVTDWLSDWGDGCMAKRCVFAGLEAFLPCY